MKPYKKNIKSTVYKKQFRSFSDAIIEMTHCCPVLRSLLKIPEEATEKDISTERIYNSIAELATTYTPNIAKRENMHWEFQISGNNVYVKTDRYISFGWNIKSEVERSDDGTKYTNVYYLRITLYGDIANDDASRKILLDSGWKEKVLNNKEEK